ncbi:MAG: hypothetical protein DRP87_10155 [Spirochaetes bacterium]|nr:MAG: hypothetical protein DRP87_10155 [Spirochaetota bacterium]
MAKPAWQSQNPKDRSGAVSYKIPFFTTKESFVPMALALKSSSWGTHCRLCPLAFFRSKQPPKEFPLKRKLLSPYRARKALGFAGGCLLNGIILMDPVNDFNIMSKFKT